MIKQRLVIINLILTNQSPEGLHTLQEVLIYKMYLVKTDVGVAVEVKWTITKLFHTFQHLPSVAFCRRLHVVKLSILYHDCQQKSTREVQLKLWLTNMETNFNSPISTEWLYTFCRQTPPVCRHLSLYQPHTITALIILNLSQVDTSPKWAIFQLPRLKGVC